MDGTDQPNSICHIQRIQMYPVPLAECKFELPFKCLPGEGVKHSGNSTEGFLVLTNYRLFVQLCDSQHHVPLGLIEAVEHRDLFYLHIGCKDARTYRCVFDNNEVCLSWFGHLLESIATSKELEQLFAFYYYVWSKEDERQIKIDDKRRWIYDEETFKSEVNRLKFDLHGAWRISYANNSYKLCPSYPPLILVPACITDETLETVARFRSSRRIPAVVWRHAGNGAIIARCSQPEVGWLGWRSAEDESLLQAICDACTYDRGLKTMLDNSSNSPCSLNSEDSNQTQLDISVQDKKKVLILDARSYTTAVANRARGGGCECPEYYPSCEIQFMNLANIHSIRKSFHALRQLCMSSAEQPNWFSQLEGTRWLQHISGLMKAAVTLVTAVERDARPVLVHCSDGWDRTPQIVTLAEILLDPYYRTMDGFRVLIEREWLAFGHKFADRCGHATGSDDQNERCPVFLQWLDCVHQLLKQFPCAFEFCDTYLVKLAQHTYSNLFGTFLCNTKQDRVSRVIDYTYSVWGFLNSMCFRNHLYPPPNAAAATQVLWPQCNVRDLFLWSEVYLGSLEMHSTSESGFNSSPGPPGAIPNHMIKTRSYGDLLHASDTCPSHFRRNSDPNIIVDTKKINGLSINGESIIPKASFDTDGGACNGFSSTEIDCNNDCIYKNATVQNLSDDSVDMLDCNVEDDDDDDNVDGNADGDGVIEIAQNGDGVGDDTNDKTKVLLKSSEFILNDTKSNVICSEKTDLIKDSDLYKSNLKDVNNFESICLYKSHCDPNKRDINHNGDDFDSDTECTEPSESKSENTVCDLIPALDNVSIETSTETITFENPACEPKELNGFEKLSNVDFFNGNGDLCKVCAQYKKFGKHSHHQSGSTSGKTSQYSTPPLYSRTPSANGWDDTLNVLAHQRTFNAHQCRLGDDGLVPLKSYFQEKLRQILEDHRRREEALQRELHTYRQALIQRVCHRCNHNENDRQDETSSVVESLCSAGEGHASAVESLRSDMSWENVDENSSLHDQVPTLWVPDHAVTRCTGCHTEFWLGRRKHHCRNCGRIFCADCSENSTPVPSEQLYEPVRVCSGCYSKLRRDCGEIPDHCAGVVSEPLEDAWDAEENQKRRGVVDALLAFISVSQST